MRHGGRILTDQLQIQGVERIFCVPGESFLAALDGLHDSTAIETVICRQEGGAVMMAEADGKLSGRPGVAFVTRGPGATNGSIGVHLAMQDSTPMVLFVGLPGSDMVDREAFQEFDFLAFFRAIAKSAEIVSATARLPEYISRAFHVARAGRPGPVVIGLPEDVLSGMADIADARPARPAEACPAISDLDALADALSIAERPLMLVGGPGWSREIRQRVEDFCNRFELPVAASFRCQDYIGNHHACYAGHVGIGIDPNLAKAVRDADLLIVMGARLGEMTTSGYTLVSVPNPEQRLIHIHPAADELGRVYRPEIAIAASSARFAAALETLSPSAAAQVPARQHWRQMLRKNYESFCEPVDTPGPVKLEHVMGALRDMLPDDAIVSNGAGNYSAWLHRYFSYRDYRTQLAPTNGSMGYGLPAAIAAQFAHRTRKVVALAGDGCFLMNGQELATAAQYGLSPIVIVINNGMYGTIRMHQEREYPGRVHGTSLANPDFAALARAYGGHGETVLTTAEFRPALRRCLEAGTLALIEIRIDPEALTPRQSLSAIRATSMAARKEPDEKH